MLEAEERLKGLVTEARGVLRDLREEKQRVIKYIETKPRELVAAEVTKQLEVMGRQTEAAMEASVKKVFAEFDKLQKILLGQKNNNGEKDLFELAQEKVNRDKGIS